MDVAGEQPDGAPQEAEHKGRKTIRGLEQAANHLVLLHAIFTDVWMAAVTARKKFAHQDLRAAWTFTFLFAISQL